MIFNNEKFAKFSSLGSEVITPSILNVPIAKRVHVVNQLIKLGIQWIHYDVMDGVFVANKAISTEELIKIRKKTFKHFADAHLMVTDPTPYVGALLGWVDFITVHYESISRQGLINLTNRFCRHCHQTGTLLGIAINPDTEVSEIIPLLEPFDLVLVMSVYPGKGGQKFIEKALDKVKQLVAYREENEVEFMIQIDGGINDMTGPLALQAGADLLVSGTYLIKNMNIENINKIRGR